MYKTYYPKAGDIEPKWYIVDAKGQNLGRLATQIAAALLGKIDPMFTPGVEMANNVIVINAGDVVVTGKKLDEKIYYRHSGYPGGLKAISLRHQLQKYPDRVIRAAVWGMLPHNKMGRHVLKHLKVYASAEHPHTTNNPQPLA